ncbi:MAG: HlyD family efflux transporter periplasmic adaptor subunit [Armatimonadota bacterium]
MCFLCLLVVTSAVRALPPAMDLPQNWGAGELVQQAPGVSASFGDVQTPPLVMPHGRIILGSGTINPARYLQQRAAGSQYTIRAPLAGIIEFLLRPKHYFDAGQPLLRLYEPDILSDLSQAEQAARIFRDSPYTILQSPAPPEDFPPSVVDRPDSQPRPEPAVEPREPEPTRPVQSALSQEPQTSGIQQESPPDPEDANSETDQRKLQIDCDAASADRGELKVHLKTTEDEIANLVPELQKAKDDLAGRQELYDRGILARKALEAAEERTGELSDRMEELTARREELQASLAAANDRLQALQKKLSEARSTGAQDEARTEPGPQPEAERAINSSAISKKPKTTAPHRAETKPETEEPAPEPMVTPQPPSRPDSRAARPEQPGQQNEEQPNRRGTPGIPRIFDSLSEPKWESVSAPTHGFVTEHLAADGDTVEAGDELLRISNTQWTRLYADLDPEHIASYRTGTPVAVVFDGYSDVRLEGWISDLKPMPETGTIRAEMAVLCTSGFYDDDAYATVRWLSQAAPLNVENSTSVLAPMTEEVPVLNVGPDGVYAMFPVVPVEYGPAHAVEHRRVDGQYAGYIRAVSLSSGSESKDTPQGKARLKALQEWRASFTEGMTTAIFDNELMLTYPADGRVNRAVERMATGQVSHAKNRCARTMAEAIGFGLGDAAQWANRLPAMGYVQRADGVARPGDILVWQFTYGPGNTQHIGLAVLQSGRLMLLSNLAGRLGTSEVLPGYLAFHRPDRTASVSED